MLNRAGSKYQCAIDAKIPNLESEITDIVRMRRCRVQHKTTIFVLPKYRFLVTSHSNSESFAETVEKSEPTLVSTCCVKVPGVPQWSEKEGGSTLESDED